MVDGGRDVAGDYIRVVVQRAHLVRDRRSLRRRLRGQGVGLGVRVSS